MNLEPARLTPVHRRRLREVWRSAGWPSQDLVEVELIAAGLLERRVDEAGRETLRVSDRGVEVLAATLQGNRRARDPHEELVARVALQMHRAGRLVWRGISLRAPLEPSARDDEPALEPPGAVSSLLTPAALAGSATAASARWAIAMPDVFSVRHTTVPAYLEPVIHEIKVSRADLLGDLRRPDKRAAYQALAGECWYVLKEGIGTAADVPEACGVMLATTVGFEVLRPAPRRERALSFGTWMALAKATRCDFGDDQTQGAL